MEDRLLHNMLELKRRLELAEKKLDIALQGLQVISNGTDIHRVASKTLNEIDSI